MKKKDSWFNTMIKGFFQSEAQSPMLGPLDTTHLDTETGDMNEAAGGSIPMSNLTKLKRMLEYKTLREIMA